MPAMGVLFKKRAMPIEYFRAVPFGMPGSSETVGIGSTTEHARPNGETAWGASVGGTVGIDMTDQRHDYREYYINIMPHAAGWRATIYAPDSEQPMLGPQPDDPTDYNEVLDKAKALIDVLLSS